jgi:hypothetical protein
MDVKKICFDMDGVLADFDCGIIELCGMRSKENKTGLTHPAHIPGGCGGLLFFINFMGSIQGFRVVTEESQLGYWKRHL